MRGTAAVDWVERSDVGPASNFVARALASAVTVELSNSRIANILVDETATLAFA
jgi:hypothetical protein